MDVRRVGADVLLWCWGESGLLWVSSNLIPLGRVSFLVCSFFFLALGRVKVEQDGGGFWVNF